MCGIVGYTGHQQAQRIVLDSLKKLEYRGYDSSGIACSNDNNLDFQKSVGKISNLIHGLNNTMSHFNS